MSNDSNFCPTVPKGEHVLDTVLSPSSVVTSRNFRTRQPETFTVTRISWTARASCRAANASSVIHDGFRNRFGIVHGAVAGEAIRPALVQAEESVSAVFLHSGEVCERAKGPDY